MKKAKKVLTGLLAAPFAVFAMSPIAGAQYNLGGGVNDAKGEGVAESANPAAIVTNVINVALWVVGVLAVIMLIWGGIKYATSAGDANKVTSAKNTVMYAVIGLVVAIFAYAIVNFVVTEL